MGVVGVVDLMIENPFCGWYGALEMVVFSIVAGLTGSLVSSAFRLLVFYVKADR